MVNYKQQNSPVGFPVPIRNVNEIETDSETSAGAAGGGGRQQQHPNPTPSTRLRLTATTTNRVPPTAPSHTAQGVCELIIIIIIITFRGKKQPKRGRRVQHWPLPDKHITAAGNGHSITVSC